MYQYTTGNLRFNYPTIFPNTKSVGLMTNVPFYPMKVYPVGTSMNRLFPMLNLSASNLSIYSQANLKSSPMSSPAPGLYGSFANHSANQSPVRPPLQDVNSARAHSPPRQSAVSLDTFVLDPPEGLMKSPSKIPAEQDILNRQINRIHHKPKGQLVGLRVAEIETSIRRQSAAKSCGLPVGN